MLLESLVIYTCLSGSDCQTPAQAYFLTYPEIKEFADNAQTKANNYFGKKILDLSLGMIGVVAAKEGSFYIGKGFSITVSNKNNDFLSTLFFRIPL